jgi:hypothetical protein
MVSKNSTSCLTISVALIVSKHNFRTEARARPAIPIRVTFYCAGALERLDRSLRGNTGVDGKSLSTHIQLIDQL